MVEIDGMVEVVGPDGPVPFLDLFQGRDELVIYHSMWYDGAPHQGQCEGCTFNLWHMRDAVYLNARGVSFAVLTSGRWDEVAPYVEDRKSTRLNSSHANISYAVFCLKKKKKIQQYTP